MSIAMISSVEANDLVVAAFKAGWHARDREVAALQLDADRLWLISFGDQKGRDFLLNRLDRIAAMSDPDAELDEVFAAYCESLRNVRQEVRDVR